MTTVVAVQERGNVVFASDSQVSWGGRKSLSQEKVFVNSGVVFGCAGDVRVANVLRTAELPVLPAPVRSRSAVFGWLVTVLVPAMQGALEAAGALTVDQGQTNNRGEFLVAVNNQVFEVGGDFAVTEERSGRYSVGSGSGYALGALAVGAGVREAVEVSIGLDAFSGGRVRVVNSSEVVR